MPSARRVAIDALTRVEDGAYANLVLPALLERSGLDERDRNLVTELVYGTTRMRRAVDWLLAPHLRRDVEPVVRAALRVGAYQLAFLHTPAHAAVGETVGATPVRARSLVNAVLRNVAAAPLSAWPDDATALSYPDWVIEALTRSLGAERARTALETMNAPATVTRRADGYVQDLASQWVAGLVDVRTGDVVVDLCAGPGGKATALAEAGARVVLASDVLPARAALVVENAVRLGLERVVVAVADGRRPPMAPGGADRVLVDAPCSGLGVLRRRPDARWRMTQDDVEGLAGLQRDLLHAAISLLAPGALLVYSVCTLTLEETVEIDDWLRAAHPRLEAVDPPDDPWEPVGRGARLLPQAAGTDGMYVLRLRPT